MPNSERDEEAVARARLKNGTLEGLRQTILETRGDVEIPLRDALRMINVLGMVETPRTDGDARSVAYVAREAAVRLELVADELRGLFRACVADF